MTRPAGAVKALRRHGWKDLLPEGRAVLETRWTRYLRGRTAHRPSPGGATRGIEPATPARRLVVAPEGRPTAMTRFPRSHEGFTRRKAESLSRRAVPSRAG